MVSENGQHGDPETDQATEQALESSGGEGHIVDEPDEPVNPDERTQAEAEAARIALSPRAPRRKYKAPRSIAIMLMVVAMVVAVGIYALQWALRMRDNNIKAAAETELRELEERAVMAPVQATRAANLTAITRRETGDPNIVVRPPGKEYKPLTPEETTRMQALEKAWGVQFKPDEKQLQQIEEAKLIEAKTATSQPATP